MSIAGIGARSLLMVQSLVDMRTQLGDLQRQMATGKKSETYAGLGLNRGLSVSLRSHLAAMESYKDTIKNVGVRIDVAQTALTRISALGQQMKSVSGQMNSPVQRAAARETAKNAVDEIVGLLNAQVGDRYVFSGMAADTPAVAKADAILYGDGIRAGLQQLIAERAQADLGASGLGRLVVGAPSATAIELAEDAAGSAFGFKLANIGSTLTGATVTAPAGSPPAMGVDLGAVNPNDGEELSLTFTLPDGSTETIRLTATSATPQAGQFAIGATSADTAANLQAAVTDALGGLARTALTAASAIAASDNFFAEPPLRVAGPPFDSATGLVAGTPANTVSWYTGESGSGAARGTATARIDQSITVSYGLRANEDGIRWQLQQIAVLAAMPMTESDPDIQGKTAALSQRLNAALTTSTPGGDIAVIQSELAGARTAMAAATQRHQESKATLQDLLQGIDGVDDTEVAAKILTLQTRMEASLRATSMLYQTSIVNYL